MDGVVNTATRRWSVAMLALGIVIMSCCTAQAQTSSNRVQTDPPQSGSRTEPRIDPWEPQGLRPSLPLEGGDPVPTPLPFEFFPQSLLWEPPVANPREPRLFARFTSYDNAFTESAIDTGIGGVFGLFRYTEPCRDWQVQLDISALALARYSDFDTLVANDYRAG